MKKHAELSPTLVQKDNFDLCIHLAYTSKVFFNFLKFVSSQTLSHKMGRKKYYSAALFKIKRMYDKVHTYCISACIEALS